MASEFDFSREEEEIEANATERSADPSPDELILSFNQEEDEILEGYGRYVVDRVAEASSVVPNSPGSPVRVSGFDEEEGGQLNSRPNFHVNESYRIDDDCNHEAVQKTSFTASSSSAEFPAVPNGFDEEEDIEELEESRAVCVVAMASSEDESHSRLTGSGEDEQAIERVEGFGADGAGPNSEGISGERNRPTENAEKEELELSDELMPESISHVSSGLHGVVDQFLEEDGEFAESTRSGILLGLESPETDIQEESSSGIFLRDNSEQEFEAPSSPSSSGYAGERGSSNEASASESSDSILPYGDEENSEIRCFSDSGRDPDSDRVLGKRHLLEDDASLSWRKRKKHFIILSNSGKPIYSRYGDEHKLAGFSATLQAIISFMENGGDHVKFVRAGKHQVIFLVKGPIYLVCVSCTDEPYEALRGQLELIYGQMLVILTKSVNRCFQKNPKFDMTPLLGGTDVVFSSLIHFFSRNPATFMHIRASLLLTLLGKLQMLYCMTLLIQESCLQY